MYVGIVDSFRAGPAPKPACRVYPHGPRFNHLIRLEEQRLRNGQPERLGCLHVDHEFELGQLRDGTITGLGAFQDLIDEVEVHEPSSSVSTTDQPSFLKSGCRWRRRGAGPVQQR